MNNFVHSATQESTSDESFASDGEVASEQSQHPSKYPPPLRAVPRSTPRVTPLKSPEQSAPEQRRLQAKRAVDSDDRKSEAVRQPASAQSTAWPQIEQEVAESEFARTNVYEPDTIRAAVEAAAHQTVKPAAPKTGTPQSPQPPSVSEPQLKPELKTPVVSAPQIKPLPEVNRSAPTPDPWSAPAPARTRAATKPKVVPRKVPAPTAVTVAPETPQVMPEDSVHHLASVTGVVAGVAPSEKQSRLWMALGLAAVVLGAAAYLAYDRFFADLNEPDSVAPITSANEQESANTQTTQAPAADPATAPSDTPTGDDAAGTLKPSTNPLDSDGSQAMFVPSEQDSVWMLSASPNEPVVVSAGGDGTIKLWDAKSGQQVGETIAGHDNFVNAAVYSSDGSMIASVSDDGTASVWDASTSKKIGDSLEGHSDWVYGVAFSPDGGVLATSSLDSTIRLWDPQTGQSIGEPLEGHVGSVVALAFNPVSGVLASAGEDNQVIMWDIDSGEQVQTPLAHNGGVVTVAFSPDGSLLATTSQDGLLRVWDTDTSRVVIEVSSGTSSGVAFDPTGGYVATGSTDGIIQVWDALTGAAAIEPFAGHDVAIYSLAFASDGTLVSADELALIAFWDLDL